MINLMFVVLNLSMSYSKILLKYSIRMSYSALRPPSLGPV